MRTLNYIAAILFAPLLISTLSAQQEFPADLENPNMFDQNKEQPHSTFIPFDDVKGVLEND